MTATSDDDPRDPTTEPAAPMPSDARPPASESPDATLRDDGAPVIWEIATPPLRTDAAAGPHTPRMEQRRDVDDRTRAEPRIGEITVLLRRAGVGDAAAEADLYRLVYDALREQAAQRIRGQRRGHTLQATALVHEVYLKVARLGEDWAGRGHFFGVAASAMRSILVDHARSKRRVKRGGDGRRQALDDVHVVQGDDVLDIVALDDALVKLAALDARAARVVELMFFGGLTAKEIAEILDVTERTVERDWKVARAWLKSELDP